MRSQPESRPAPIEAAVDALLAGELVAFPTETVYGLGADASNADAVRAIFAAKGRPTDHPVIVHLASADALLDWSDAPSASAVALAEAFWPGPLTLLVPRAAHVLDAVTGGRASVGLRVPSHAVAHELLTAFADRSPHGGVAAPSANRFGRVSPTSASDVRNDLGDAVGVVLDGGASAVGVESTIVDCTVEPPMILRHGAITTEMLEVVVVLQDVSGPSRASGMLASHYAPRCTIVAAESVAEARQAMRFRRDLGELVDVFDASRDVQDAAHRLYREFRIADELGLNTLIVVLPNAEGLGRAIRDRVLKASAAR
jgi:L-threonylcarbamoyladenylate synthase